VLRPQLRQRPSYAPRPSSGQLKPAFTGRGLRRASGYAGPTHYATPYSHRQYVRPARTLSTLTRAASLRARHLKRRNSSHRRRCSRQNVRAREIWLSECCRQGVARLTSIGVTFKFLIGVMLGAWRSSMKRPRTPQQKNSTHRRYVGCFGLRAPAPPTPQLRPPPQFRPAKAGLHRARASQGVRLRRALRPTHPPAKNKLFSTTQSKNLAAMRAWLSKRYAICFR